MTNEHEPAAEADRFGRVLPMDGERLARLAAENRRLREALRTAHLHALESAAMACAAAEVPSESGGLWHLGLTDESTRQACVDAVQRLLYAERTARGNDPVVEPAEVVRLRS